MDYTVLKQNNLVPQEWMEILQHFSDYNHSYAEQYAKKNKYYDCAYWYNEITNVGVVACGISKANGFSLVEYVSKKGSGRGYSGRRDLYFNYNGLDGVCEAKFDWVKLSSKLDTNKKTITKSIQEADKNMRDSLNKHTSATFGASICFFPIYYKNSTNVVRAIEEIDSLFEQLILCDYTIKIHHLNNVIRSESGNSYVGLYVCGNIYQK